jgi:hypothetical protein
LAGALVGVGGESWDGSDCGHCAGDLAAVCLMETKMETEDWSYVIFNNLRDHCTNREAVAKALSVALIGDDKDWRQHLTNAARFIEEMAKTRPTIRGLEDRTAA